MNQNISVQLAVNIDVEAEKKRIFDLNQKWYKLETAKQLDARALIHLSIYW